MYIVFNFYVSFNFRIFKNYIYYLYLSFPRCRSWLFKNKVDLYNLGLFDVLVALEV